MLAEHSCERGDIFECLKDKDWFASCFRHEATTIFERAGMLFKYSDRRLFDAQDAWVDDVFRVGHRDLNGGDPDHFKRCGHLSYWLRRCSPITETWFAPSLVQMYGESFQDLEEDSLEVLLIKYANEYIAFDIGYRICRFFEDVREDSTMTTDYPYPSRQYQRIVSHFMKQKNVSPHALYLIFLSLLENARVIYK